LVSDEVKTTLEGLATQRYLPAKTKKEVKIYDPAVITDPEIIKGFANDPFYTWIPATDPDKGLQMLIDAIKAAAASYNTELANYLGGIFGAEFMEKYPEYAPDVEEEEEEKDSKLGISLSGLTDKQTAYPLHQALADYGKSLNWRGGLKRFYPFLFSKSEGGGTSEGAVSKYTIPEEWLITVIGPIQP
jgi:hypothetical protein